MSDDVPATLSEKIDPQTKAKARALWERLANSRPGPNNKDLLYLARFVPVLSSAAIKTLFTRKLNVEELKEIVQHVPKARDAAVKAALKSADSLSDDDLRFLITHTKSKDAAKLLLKRNSGNSVIIFLERTVEELQGSLDEIKKKELTSVVLKEIDRLL
ncbi:MAG: hypothetical protein MK102_02105 [Fuerstiella sp.]|nr:hypothetical protein [Fuerstiella sp.]